MNKKLLSIIASTTLFSNLALADENSGFFIGAGGLDACSSKK